MGTIDSPSLIFDSLDFSPTEHRLNDDGQTQEGTFAHVAGAQHQRRVATAYEMLRQYSTTDQPSRPSSPKSVQAHKQYLQELGRISPVSCDKVIFNVFIGLYFVHVAPTLPCFKDQVLDSSTLKGCLWPWLPLADYTVRLQSRQSLLDGYSTRRSGS